MAHGFVPVRRNQALLLPPDLREWLTPDHLAWFVLDAVEQLDLATIYDRYRTGAQGRAAYDPKMMVALLLYAYAAGVRSSREIERRLTEDIAFRVIAANRSVDHATICRFRRDHEDALSELFVEIVGLCVAAGMVKTTVVAIDGTKVAANASSDRNVDQDQLRQLAARVFEEAEAIDAEEDRRYGDRRGDEIPEHLRDRAERIEWMRRQLADRNPTTRSGDAQKINTTDPDSRVMKTPTGYLQGYNVQLAVSDDHVIIAADLTTDAADVAQLKPMIEQAKDNLEQVEGDDIATIVADAGYLSRHNVELATGSELLIAPTSKHRLDDAIENCPDVGKHSSAWGGTRLRPDDVRRRAVLEAYINGQATAREAATALFTTRWTVYHWAWQLRKFERLPAARVVLPKPAPVRAVMLERLGAPPARAAYARRSELVEPVIGQLKELRGLRRFLHRGKSACRCELRMVGAAHNLRRLWVAVGLRGNSDARSCLNPADPPSCQFCDRLLTAGLREQNSPVGPSLGRARPPGMTEYPRFRRGKG
jgi:transposase